MLKFFLCMFIGWLIIPALLFSAWCWLAGGERLLQRETFIRLLHEARSAHEEARSVQTEAKWTRTQQAFETALAAAKYEDQVTVLRIRLDLARIPMERRDREQDAVEPLEDTLDGLAKQAGKLKDLTPDDDRAYLLWRDVRSLQAEALYAIAQKNRRDPSKTVPDWKAHADRSRDSYRELLTAANDRADADAFLRFQRNLEVVINLLRIEEEVFQATPFPHNSPDSKDCLKRSRKYQAKQQEQQRSQPKLPDKASPIEQQAKSGVKTS
jgi:hypothetical protein